MRVLVYAWACMVQYITENSNLSTVSYYLHKHVVRLASAVNKPFLAFICDGWDFLGYSPAKRHPLGVEIAEWRAFQLKTGTCKIPRTQLSAHNSLTQVDTASLRMAVFQINCENLCVIVTEVLWQQSAYESTLLHKECIKHFWSESAGTWVWRLHSRLRTCKRV